MLAIETIDLSELGITLPHEKVGIVVAQPYVNSSLTQNEPFRWNAQDRARQIAVINRTLDIALQASHGAGKTHFTIFPEYSIPGLGGFQAIQGRLETTDWPNETLVIGGLDGLSKADYSALLALPNVHTSQSSSPAQVPDTSWVNCAAIWAKSSDGSIHVWIQPKLAPAAEEAAAISASLFPGKSIFIFKGPLSNRKFFRFAALICFDWIATIGDKRSFEWILESLDSSADEGQLPLTWLFVVQNNKKPSDPNFLSRVEPFFDPTRFPKAERANAGLIFANTAGADSPRKLIEYGGASVVFCPGTSFAKAQHRPTVCDGGAKFRDGSPTLNGYKDAFFRERGACIHSFAQINPTSFGYGPANRTFSVDNAFVYSIDDSANSRAPNGPVPAAVKWVNDELDTIKSVGSHYATAPLSAAAILAHARNVPLVRQLNGEQAGKLLAVSTPDTNPREADNWGAQATVGLQHFIDCLDILTSRDANPATLIDGSQAVLMIGDTKLRLMAVQGSHHEVCTKHAIDRGNDGTIIPTIIVSKDKDNTPWDKRLGSFLNEATTSTTVDGERPITDPETAFKQIGYERLLSLFRNSPSIDELFINLKEEING